MRGMAKWLPFKSLKGQYDILDRAKKEKRKVRQPELSEDGQEEIDRALHLLRKGDRTMVTFYCNGEILTREEVFLRADGQERRVYFLGFSLTLGNLLSLKKA